MAISTPEQAQKWIANLSKKVSPELLKSFQNTPSSHRCLPFFFRNSKRHPHSLPPQELLRSLEKTQSILKKFPAIAKQPSTQKQLREISHTLIYTRSAIQSHPTVKEFEQWVSSISRRPSLYLLSPSTRLEDSAAPLCKAFMTALNNGEEQKADELAETLHLLQVLSVGSRSLFIAPCLSDILTDAALKKLLDLNSPPSPLSSLPLSVYLAHCPRLSQKAIDILLSWSPAIDFVDLHRAPHLMPLPVVLKGGIQVSCHPALLTTRTGECPLFSQQAPALDLPTLSPTAWRNFRSYLFRGALPKDQTPDVQIWEELTSLGISSLTEMYGRFLAEYTLEICWDQSPTKDFLLSVNRTAAFARKIGQRKVLRQLSYYQSFVIGRCLLWGEVNSPRNLDPSPNDLLEVALSELTEFDLAAFSSQEQRKGMKEWRSNESDLQEMAGPLQWVKRVAKHFRGFLIDGACSLEEQKEMGEFIQENFPDTSYRFVKKGTFYHSELHNRQILVGKKFSRKVPHKLEVEKGNKPLL